MGKIFLKNISAVNYIIIVLSFVLFPLFIRNADRTNAFAIAVSANYITLILNNIYIYTILKRINAINLLYDKIICRIGQKEFFKKYLKLIIVSIIIYFVILYGGLYLLLGLPNIYIIPYLIFIIINFTVFMIEELICLLMLGDKKNAKLIIAPIIINLAFHYVIAQHIISWYI